MDKTQFGVMRGVGLAMLTTLAVFAVSITYGPRFLTISADLSSRGSLAAWAVLLPASALFVCIARLATHRFFTPADIQGSGLTAGTDRAKLLQALLQNTLEQCGLAVPVYIAASVIAPAPLLPLVPCAAAMFLIGRLFFFAGYENGAPARAYGFGMTFYPTVLLLLFVVALGAWALAG